MVLLVLFITGLFGIILFFLFVPEKNKYQIKTLETQTNIVPLAVIGSGPAGLSAALYGARLGVYTVVFEGPKPGGQLTETGMVENWPGVGRERGPEIMKSMRAYVSSLGAIIIPEVIAALDINSWPFRLVTDDGQVFNALSIIVATGSAPRVLNIPGEREYWGKGITTCALCDAPFYKNKDVVIVGAGDNAFEQALQLAPHARTVTILVRSDRVRASVGMQQQVRALTNVSVVSNKEVKQVQGTGEWVNQLLVFDNKRGAMEQLKADGLFLAIGHEPRTALVAGKLKLRADGSIMIKNGLQQTSVPGVFAAGDVEDIMYRQAGVAAGSGIKAAIEASKFLQLCGWNSTRAQQLQTRLYNPGAVSVAGKSDLPVRAESKVRQLNSVEMFEREVLKAKQPVVIDFYAHHCPSCMHMMPIFDSVARQFASKLLFYKVDTSATPALAERLKVERIPCFIVFNGGEQVARYHSIMSKPEMIAFVRQFE